MVFVFRICVDLLDRVDFFDGTPFRRSLCSAVCTQPLASVCSARGRNSNISC